VGNSGDTENASRNDDRAENHAMSLSDEALSRFIVSANIVSGDCGEMIGSCSKNVRSRRALRKSSQRPFGRE
jgi:hypothetical protein